MPLSPEGIGGTCKYLLAPSITAGTQDSHRILSHRLCVMCYMVLCGWSHLPLRTFEIIAVYYQQVFPMHVLFCL